MWGSGPSPALAHKVVIFGYADGDMLKTESSFTGGNPVIKGKISMYAMPERKLIGEGLTDNNGMWETRISKIPTGIEGIELSLDAGGGHAASWFMKPEDYGVSKPEGSIKKAANSPVPASDNLSAQKDNEDNGYGESLCRINRKELEMMMAGVVQREVAPLKRIMLETLNNDPDIREILGAIGYIAGIAGLIAYFRSKKS